MPPRLFSLAASLTASFAVLFGVLAIAPMACGRRAVQTGKDAGPAADAMPGVTADESATWTWSFCGTIPAAPVAVAAMLSSDARTVAVRDRNNAILLYDARGDTAPTTLPAVDGVPADALAFSPDATLLATMQAGGVTLRRVPDGEIVRRFEQSDRCGPNAATFSFSSSGQYVLSHASGNSCVWRVSDGALIASFFSGGSPAAAIRGETIVTLSSGAVPTEVAVVSHDFLGQEVARRTLALQGASASNLVLSPSGDRVAAWGSPGALFDVDSGARLLSFDRDFVNGATFTYRGDQVLMGDGVFETRGGTRLKTMSPGINLSPVAGLAPDGETVLLLGPANVALGTITSPGFLRVFGAPAQGPASDNRVTQLALSADGGTLVSQGAGWYAFGLRLAPRFEDSTTLWWASAGDVPMATDISADGRLVAVSGDNRAVYDGTNGRLIWASPPPDATVNCVGTQLRFSSTARWAAGEGYGGTMDVFPTGGGSGSFPPPLAALGQTNCHDAAAFSRNDALMATSGPTLYSTGDQVGDWRPIWSVPARNPDTAGDGRMGWSAWGNDVRFSPDERTLVVSRCSDWTCKTNLHSVADGSVLRELPQLTAPHPSFSREGHWIVAGGRLLHLPSGRDRLVDASASITSAIFAPNGDIITGSNDFSLTRYCRH